MQEKSQTSQDVHLGSSNPYRPSDVHTAAHRTPSAGTEGGPEAAREHVLTMVAGFGDSSAVGRLLRTPPPKGALGLSSPQDL